MEQFELKNKYFEYRLVNDNGELKHISFLPSGYVTKIGYEDVFKRTNPYPPEAVIVCNSESYMQPHGKRAYFGGMSHRSRFIRRETCTNGADTDNVFILSDPVTDAEIRLHYIVNDESPALRRYTEIINKGAENVTLNHVSSFFLCNFPYCTNDVMKMKLHHFSSCWLYEGTHHIDSLPALDIYSDSRNAFTVESNGTWVCKDHIPFFVLEQENEKLFTAVQIETSQSWRFELGNGEPHPSGAWLYMQGGIGNETHTGWSLTLKPGDSFVSPVAAIAVSCGDCDKILNLMHLYRENVLIHHNRNDSFMPVVYNDWLNLMGTNSEDEILRQLDVLSKIGVEVYVTDDGWHVPKNRSLWDYLGHWEPDPERFPHGMKYLTEEIKRHGMKAGIWCEIEGIGAKAEHYNDESMLLMRNGRFVTDAQHRFLNFTKKKVRDYADRIFDRFAEWGFDYVKIDYNSDSVPGADNCGSENPAEGIRLNRLAYDNWLDGIRERHPDMIIENCSSGGMRLEYNSFSRADLGSITDQGDFRLLGALAYNVSKFVHPSQCGIWSWTKYCSSKEDFVLAMTNSMIGRMHLSGDFETLPDDYRILLREACDFYKKYRHILNNCEVYHHTDPVLYYRNNEKIRCFELRSRNHKETVAVAQRINCEEDSFTVRFPGLNSGQYAVSFFPYREPETLSSEELSENGITFHFTSPLEGQLVYLRRHQVKGQ